MKFRHRFFWPVHPRFFMGQSEDND